MPPFRGAEFMNISFKPLGQLVGYSLTWTQPDTFKSEYELQNLGEKVALLRFKSLWGSLATAESASGNWTFKRIGFWEPQVTIRPLGSETNIAVYTNKTWQNGGTLQLQDGRKFLASLNFWATQFEFKTEQDQPFLRYSRIGGMLHLSSQMEILPAAAGLNELPWMAILGWYLTVLSHQETAAATIAVIG
jgi:hypothetical protein